MVKREKIALLYGGLSGEHEVSLQSAASVLASLDRQKYEVIPIGMDKQGCCYVNDDQELLSYQNALPVRTERSTALPSLLVDGHFAVDADVVFPVVHGPLYEDGSLQGLLELANVAYVGSGVLASALGMDKDMARRIACVDGLLSARYRVLSGPVGPKDAALFCEHAAAELGWPLFVKPCALGSSVGIHKVQTLSELIDAVADAGRYDPIILVESFVKGREIEVAVLENSSPTGAPHVSIPGEIQVLHPDGFYSYAAKYLDSEQTLLHIPAALDDDMVQRLQASAAAIFMRLRCRGMARVDFFVNDETGTLYFNEINTLPGFTSISMYPKLWEASGLPYPMLLDRLIALAKMHHTARAQRVTHYQ
jgi:D-alanine-D-alanine ligase